MSLSLFPTFSLQGKDQRSMFWKNLSGSQFETLKTSLLKNEWTLDRIFSEMVKGMNEKCENNDDFYSDVDDEADEEHVQEEGMEEMVVMMEMMMVEETGRSVHREIRVAIGARAGGEEEHFA